MNYRLGNSYILPVIREGNRLVATLSDSSTVSVRIPDSLEDYPFSDRCAMLYGPDKPGQWSIDKRAIFRKIYKDNTVYRFQTLPGDIKNIKVTGLFGFILSIPKANNGIIIQEGTYEFLVQHHNSGVGIRLTCKGRVGEDISGGQQVTEDAGNVNDGSIDSILRDIRSGKKLYDLDSCDTASMCRAITAIASKWLDLSQELTGSNGYISDLKMITECSIMLRMLAELNPLSSFGLMNRTKELLSFCRLGRAPFDRSYIDDFNPGILAECLKNAGFVIRHEHAVALDYKGTILLKDSRYSFFPCNIENYDISYPFFVPIFNIGKEEITIYSHKDDRLETSSAHDEDKMIECVDTLLHRIKSSPLSREPEMTSYRPGDEFLCRIASISTDCGNPHIVAESIDKRHFPVSGEISLNDFYYFKDANISKALNTGDFIRVALVGDDGDEGQHLSVIECFSKFIASRLKEGTTVRASLYHKGARQNSWITKDGYTVYTRHDPEIGYNSIADIRIARIAANGYVSGDVVNREVIHAQFDPYKALRAQLQDFTWHCRQEAAHSEDIVISDRTVLNEIVMTCFKLVTMQENLRYRFDMYVAISLVSAMSGHELLGEYAAFKLRYISNLIKFTKNLIGLMKPTVPGPDIAGMPEIAQDTAIEGLICSYGYPHRNTVTVYPSDPAKRKLTEDIHALITAYNLSKDIMNRSILDSFRKRILTLLSLSDKSVNEVAYSDDNDRDFVGYESSTMEFKTSIIFEAGGSEKADFQKQARVILKTIYSFMNTSGGILYLGVNDIGYVSGVEADIRHLGLTGIDSYCRYVLDQLSLIAGRDVITSHVNADPDMDGRVVKITVTPSASLMEFEGKYYRRVGPESRIMSENSILIELDRRKQATKA